MRILILGGTGAIGDHLAQLLAQNGSETFVTSRTHRRSQNDVHYIQGDAQDIIFLQGILKEKWNAIIDFMSYSTPAFEERVDLLLESTSQYVFLSSSRVYAGSPAPLTESSPLLADVSQDKEFLSTDDYALRKARQESLLHNSERKNWTIIRPYITYSEKRLQLGVLEKESWLYRALHGRSIIFSSDICSKLTTMTYGLDVSKGIAALIGNPKAMGDTFNIMTNESTSWANVLAVYLEILEKHLGYKPKVLLLDKGKLCLPGSLKYQIVYDRLYDRRFDNSKIAQHTDIAGFTKTGTGLRCCLGEFLKNPVFKSISWEAEALKDRQAKEHTPLYEIQNMRQKGRYLMARYLPAGIYAVLKKIFFRARS